MGEITVKKLIENHPKAFQPEAAEGVDAVIQYVLTGEEGGNYIINIHDEALVPPTKGWLKPPV